MKRIKTRWDLELPESRRMAQNLVGNAKRFKKEAWGNTGKQEEPIVERTTPENKSKQLENLNQDRCSYNGQGRKSKWKRFYEKSERKMGPKVSRIPTSKLSETRR